MKKSMRFIEELKRRNVIRAAAAYVVMAWLVVQVVETISPAFGFGDNAIRIIVIILTIGFLPAVAFSWIFEITPEGLKLEKDVDRSQSITPETGKKLDRIIIAVLSIAVAYFAFDKFLLEPTRDAAREQEVSQIARSEALLESFGEASIAVLPFVDMSQEQDQEYFGDGVSEELLNLLVKIPELRVASRTSAFSFKGQNIGIPEIAERLKVAHVLEGSVRKSGSKIRITTQLIEAASDTHLWSETYDRELDDIFHVQDEIATEVVAQLQVKLLGQPPSVTPVDTEVYMLNMRAEHLAKEMLPEQLKLALELLKQSLAIDPTNPDTWVWLGTVYNNMATMRIIPIDEARRLSKEAAERAFEAAPESAVAIEHMAWRTFTTDHDYQAAARLFEKAFGLEPGNTDMIGNASMFLAALGRNQEAIRFAEYQAERDPANPVVFNNLGIRYRQSGRYSKALTAFETALQLSPQILGVNWEIGATKLQQEDSKAAAAAFAAEKSPVFRDIGAAKAFAALGEDAASREILSELITNYGKEIPYYIAQIFAFRGEAEEAFQWLKVAAETQDSEIYSLPNEPLFIRLHNDPRWLPFLESINLSPTQLGEIEFTFTLPGRAKSHL